MYFCERERETESQEDKHEVFYSNNEHLINNRLSAFV